MSFTIKTIYNRKPDVEQAKYIADGVFIAGAVRLEKNVSVWSNCSIRGDLASIIIGENTNIQENSVIHVSPCEDENFEKNIKGHVLIGKNTTIGHTCIIHACKIGDNCLIGMGSIIGDNCIIEDNSFIGAGSNVTPRSVVKSGELWLGNPAKFVRNLRDTDYEYIKKDTEYYLVLAEEFSKDN